MEICARDLEAPMNDLESGNLNTVEDALRNEEEIKSIYNDLNVVNGKDKDDQVIEVEESKKWKKEVGMEKVKYCALAREKDREVKEDLVFKSEKDGAMGIEQEKERAITSQKDDEINSLKEDLKTVREKAIMDLANLKEKARMALAQQEEVTFSLKEELRLATEAESDRWEMAKVAIFYFEEFMIFVRGLKERPQANNIEVVAHAKALVDSRIREENLESKTKQLKDMIA